MKKPTKFVIETGIPCPPVNHGESARKYPFPSMEVGESFEFPAEKKRHVVNSASQHGIRYNKKFSVRGLRVWRVA